MSYILLRYNGLYIFDDNLENFKKINLELNLEDLKEIYKNRLPEKVKNYIKENIFLLDKDLMDINIQKIQV